jgi:hypothetical protein
VLFLRIRSLNQALGGEKIEGHADDDLLWCDQAYQNQKWERQKRDRDKIENEGKNPA